MPIGAVLVFVSLHIMNALATVCAQWAGWSVGGHELDEAPAATIHHQTAA